MNKCIDWNPGNLEVPVWNKGLGHFQTWVLRLFFHILQYILKASYAFRLLQYTSKHVILTFKKFRLFKDTHTVESAVLASLVWIPW